MKQFMSTHNIRLYKEADKKYTGCTLKSMELLDCVLIGVCVVIRSNTGIGVCVVIRSNTGIGVCVVIRSNTGIGVCVVIRSNTGIGYVW